jgi:hypothetical protein
MNFTDTNIIDYGCLPTPSQSQQQPQISASRGAEAAHTWAGYSATADTRTILQPSWLTLRRERAITDTGLNDLRAACLSTRYSYTLSPSSRTAIPSPRPHGGRRHGLDADSEALSCSSADARSARAGHPHSFFLLVPTPSASAKKSGGKDPQPSQCHTILQIR